MCRPKVKNLVRNSSLSLKKDLAELCESQNYDFGFT